MLAGLTGLEGYAWNLSSRVEKHNQMIERTYALDARCKVIKSELSGLSKQVEKGE